MVRPALATKRAVVRGPDGVTLTFTLNAYGDEYLGLHNLPPDWWRDAATMLCRQRWLDGELVESGGRYSWQPG